MAESMNDSINGALDASYNKISKPMLSSITALSTSRTSAMQRALKELDDEAARLVDADKRMMPDNSVLLKSFSTYADLMITAKALIEASDNAIQDSGILLAPVSVTAKVFLPMAAEMMRRGISPLSAQALKFYREQIEGNGAKWTIPTTADYVRGYVDTKAWRDRLDGWAPGYADLTRDTIIKYIQDGAGPRSVASKMRQHAENIPRWAAENLTRTLQNTSYRDASVAMEAVNGGFIQYKIRIESLDNRTCLACVALHGTRLEPGQRVDGHYNCRASDVYILPGGGPPELMQADSRPGQRNFVKFQTGTDWFNSLPEERQKQQASFINTPAKWNAFKKGTPLSEFVGDHTDDVFGAQKIELSLKDALGEDKAKEFYEK